MAHSTMGRPRKITDAQIEEVNRHVEARLTNAEIAAKVGISLSAVRKIITGYTPKTPYPAAKGEP